MNSDAVINKLLNLGVISRTATRGVYSVLGDETTHRRAFILEVFATETARQGDYILNWVTIHRVENAWFQREPQEWQEEQERQTLRTIDRAGYHCADRQYGTHLEQIQFDEDGIRRSFGLEFEVYSLDDQQEDKLATLLDTLPAHVTERDGSLRERGVEIIFMPMSAERYIDTVKKLQSFVRENRVAMDDGSYRMAGMHTTYGVAKQGMEYPSKSDVQIRLNRLALAVKAVGTQQRIKKLFGRDFGNYRELPTSTTTDAHGNAFSNHGRDRTCWECRLLSWRCDVERVVEFLKATEVVFFRPVQAQDFMKVFEIMGSNTDGE